MAAPLKSATAKTGNILLDTKKEWRKKPRKATPRKHKPQYRKGLEIWVRDSEEVWLPATVTSVGKDGSLTATLENGQESVVVPHKDYPPVSGRTRSCEQATDLTSLSPLCEAAVLHCLRARFHSGSYSTSAGVTLIAVNPFKEVDDCYGQDAVWRYRNGGTEAKAPHVYAMAERAYSRMGQGAGPAHQSVIVSGESGAGKTWTARCLMKYLASVSIFNPGGFEPSPGDCLEKRILESNPILEAFGNAGTARNHNSSRFGKYIQLQFDRGQHIIGASIQTYLLEKTRVVNRALGERNFHIFYQLYNGVSPDEAASLGLGDHDHRLRYLPLDDPHHVDNAGEDYEAFKSTRDAMSNVGISQAHQKDIFQVLAGLLHLGNIVFASDGDSESCDVDDDDPDYQRSSAFASSLLGLEGAELERRLMFRKITATHGDRRKSVFLRPCTAEEAGTRRDCLAKLLYARLFDWLVSFMNKSTSAGRWHTFVGLLDIYGFESFQSNSLEQLCINYANEKLQQHFVAHFLRAEQEEYAAEGIPWHFFNFTDNQPCLQVIEGKGSIFSFMNEECRLNRQTDASAFNSRLLDGVAGGRHVFKPPVAVRYPAFIVRHYAGDVTYGTEGLIDKNRDHMPPELIELAAGSANPFVSQLVRVDQAELENLAGKNGKAPGKTVVSKFKTSLDSLMALLTSTAPHYIRCIKPNLACRPGAFDSGHVAGQLRACGVLETVAISARGFPARLTYAEFQQRYGCLSRTADPTVWPCTPNARDERAVRKLCVALTECVFGEGDKENDAAARAQFGKTKIFLRQGQLEELEGLRAQAMSDAATLIQRSWRQRVRQQRRRRLAAATFIQAAYRGWKVRHCLEVMNDAARVIQQAMLEHCIRRRQLRKRLEQEATTPHAESAPGDGDDNDDENDNSSDNQEFLDCRDRLSVSAGQSDVVVSPPDAPMPRPQPGGLFDFCAPPRPALLMSAGLLPRRCSRCGTLADPKPERLGDDLDGDDDDTGETAPSGDLQEVERHAPGLGGSLVRLFRKPAVDFALAAALMALLLKGPVQL